MLDLILSFSNLADPPLVEWESGRLEERYSGDTGDRRRCTQVSTPIVFTPRSSLPAAVLYAVVSAAVDAAQVHRFVHERNVPESPC